MKIISHGRHKPAFSTIKRFKCNACGCVFECDKDEYSKWNDFDGEKMIYIHRCLCPKCNHLSSETIMREVGGAL